MGTVSGGNLIIIHGSGFGPTGPNVILFDDFEGGTNGNQLATNLAPLGTWYDIGSPSDTSYSNINKVSGSLAARFDISSYGSNQHPMINTRSASPFDSFYISFWSMLPTGNIYPGDGYGGANWKVVWVTKDDSANDADICIGGNGWTWTHWFGNDSPVPSTGMGIGTFLGSDANEFYMEDGVWYRWSWWQKGRTDATGATKMIMTNSTGGTWTASSITNIQTLNSGDTNKRQQFNINGYVRETPNSYPTFDDVYIATGEYAQARVEIGNASIYTGSSILTPCLTPLGEAGTAWSTTSIQCTVRAGGLSNGTVYAYVTDADGLRSPGYAITFGSGGGDTTPPAAPINVTII